MRHLSKRTGRAVAWGLAAAGLLVAAACKDVLKVEDPQSFISSNLDNPVILPAVAAGVEGDFMATIDNLSGFTGMLSDELMNSSTWIDWKDVSDGKVRANWPTRGGNTSGPPQDALLRARFSAQDAAARLARVLKDTANFSPLMVKVKATDAWIDEYLAQDYCESPAAAGTAAVSDAQLFAQALTKFRAVDALTRAAHLTPDSATLWLAYINAGLARTHLNLGNYDSALVHAQAVPVGFVKNAIFSSNSPGQNNNLNAQGHQTQNRSETLRAKWIPFVDTIAGFMRDPYSGQTDPRLPFLHDNNNSRGYDKGADGVTRPFMSLNKFPTLDAPIAIAKKAEMNLIEAEVYWRRGDFPTAIAKMNVNRTAVGLPAFAAPATSDSVLTLLMQERFAVLFGEGHRLQDLNRLNYFKQAFGAAAVGRAPKLPMSMNEAINNAAIGPTGEKCPTPIS